jgi:hypothetical protein
MSILIYLLIQGREMIIKEDIKAGEIISVLIEVPDIESFAKVLSNEGDYLLVTYLSPSDKVYKGAKVFSFESKAERVDFESISEHYQGVVDIEEIGIIKINKNMFVHEDDIDSESESEIETDDSDSDSEGSLVDFIVPDDETVMCKPCDHRRVDEAWNSWRPASAGAQRFKDRIDRMEEYMNSQIDEKFNFKKSV